MKKLLLLLCLSLPAFGQIINPSDTTSGNASGAFSTLTASGLSWLKGGVKVGAGNPDDGTTVVGKLACYNSTSHNYTLASHTACLASPLYFVGAIDHSTGTCSGGSTDKCSWFAGVPSQVSCAFDATAVVESHYVGLSPLTDGLCADLGATIPLGVTILGTVNQVGGAGSNSYTAAIASPLYIKPPVVTTSVAGLAPTLDNNIAHFLNGQGGWTTPSAGTQTYYFPFGTASTVTIATSNFFFRIGGGLQASTNQQSQTTNVPFTGTLTQVCVINSNSGSTSGGDVTFTVQQNTAASLPADTAITATVTSGTATLVNTCGSVGSVALTAGKTLDVRAISTSTGAALNWNGYIVVTNP